MKNNYLILLVISVVFLTGCQNLNNAFSDSILQKAKSYCRPESTVYVCGENIQVVSDVPGLGYVYYRSDGTQFSCPVVNPEYDSKDCKSVRSETCQLICGE
jgi:hypothetical protein